MPVTKVDCDMLESDCVTALRNSFSFTFDDDSDRDSFFSQNLSLLENDGVKNTLAFVGTTSLKYSFWNGANNPDSYDASGWVEIPVNATTTTADIHYWGDANIDGSMRARRDTSTGFLHFERRVNGAWVDKLTISNSITVDSAKFVESLVMPTVVTGELGLYGAKLKDSEASDAYVIRPVFMDTNHKHYMVVAGMPDGSLRVPTNPEQALADPENVPLQYHHVLFDDQADKIALLLKGKISYNDLTDKPAVTGAMTWQEIVQAADDDTTGSKLAASHIEGVIAAHEVFDIVGDMTINAINLDSYNGKVLDLVKADTSSQRITLPQISSVTGPWELTLINTRGVGKIADIFPYSGDKLASGSYYRLRNEDSVTITKPATGNDWLVTSRVTHRIEGGRISG